MKKRQKLGEKGCFRLLFPFLLDKIAEIGYFYCIMKIIYIANVRIPTEKAHGRQIMEMCGAFRAQGIDLFLITADRNNPQFKNMDAFAYYGIKNNFSIWRAWNIDLTAWEMNKIWGRFGTMVQSFSFALAAFCETVLSDVDIIYARDPHPLFFLSFFKNNLVYEIHKMPNSFLWAHRFLLWRVKGIVVITEGIKKALIEKFGIAPEKILVVPDGVDIEKFDIHNDEIPASAGMTDKMFYKKQLNLPQDKKIILYSGHLFRWKGVYVLADAAQFLPEDYQVVFVGGMEYDIARLKSYAEKQGLKNLTFLGHQEANKIPQYLKSADVLVLPNSREKEISRICTSPMKMFEYMVARRPIVASDLPSLREILDGNTAYLFEADNSRDLADKIKESLQNVKKTDRITEDAFVKVQEYAWSKRAEKIIVFIN